MPPLDPTDFPDINAGLIAEINELSDAQLHAEIQKSGNSRFGATRQPTLSAALALRQDETRRAAYVTEIEIAKAANSIASDALTEAKKANINSKWARFWSGFAVLISVALALIQYFK